MWKILFNIFVLKLASAYEQNNLNFQVVHGTVYSVSNQSIPVLQKTHLKNLDKVKTLFLSNDQIEKIEHGTFHQLPLLKVLHMSQNKLHSIEEGIFNGLQLTTLTLVANSIAYISPKAFDNMTDLIGISVTQNPLNYWDSKWFNNTPSLIIINFDFNRIEEIGAEAFRNFQGDRSLAISFNSNKIKRIDDNAFTGVGKLTRLCLKNNELETLEGNLISVKIQSLDISQNKIRCIDDEDFDKIFVASVTHVKGNPWDCDCFRKVKEWTRMNGLKLKSGKRSCAY